MADAARTGDGQSDALSAEPTIFALSSGALPAAIAVVRISGTSAAAVLSALSGRKLPPPRSATLTKLRDTAGALLDHALVIWFPAPATATGEDVVELHLHGGRAVVAAVLDALAARPGLRPALPGEFTRRALLNGRMDLTEAEALGDLLLAETELQRRGALTQFEGGLRRLIERWQSDLLTISAAVEALIDFSDEGDVDVASLRGIDSRRLAICEQIASALAMPPAERLRDGVRVAVAGPPNAGKSTLINALAGRAVSIESPYAGTTRDLIEAPIALDGVPMVLIDTAGLHADPSDPIEAIGIDRARAALAQVDVILALDDEWQDDPRAVGVTAKADLVPGAVRPGSLAVSAKTGLGLGELREALVDRVRSLLPLPDRVALNTRHRGVLAAVHLALSEQSDDVLVIAENLRYARERLNVITGASGTEEMLDALFARFCIGK